MNNAGVIGTHTETADISADERKRVMAVNVRVCLPRGRPRSLMATLRRRCGTRR